MQSIVAYDIELDGENLVTRSSKWETRHQFLEDALDSLCLQASPDEIAVTWCLDETVSPILRLLGEDLCRKLWHTGRCFARPFSVFYIPSKIFSLHRVGAKEHFNLVGIEQYFPEQEEPKEINEVAALGQKVLDAFHEMKMWPDRLTSPIAAYEACQAKNLSIPTGHDMPKEAALLAWQCGGKLLIEAYKLGTFEKAYDYDLKSSFPSIARNLVDFRDLEWVHSAEYQPKAIYGYTNAEIKIPDNVRVSPIIHESDTGELSTPYGWWGTQLTKGEIDFVRKWDIGEIEIIDGWWCLPKQGVEARFPLQEPIDRVLAWKSSPNPIVSLIAKRISVGNFYGKFGEELKRGFGVHWSPVYFAEISTSIRLKVADFIYRNRIVDSVIHVSVDGVLSEREVTLPDTNGAGSWALDSVSPALVCSSGLMWLGGKRPKGMRLDDVLALINAYPSRSYYEREVLKRVTLGEALNNGHFEELGMYKPHYETIDLNLIKQDRDFSKVPHTGKELLTQKFNSRPNKVWEV